jgi:hypothetical protein
MGLTGPCPHIQVNPLSRGRLPYLMRAPRVSFASSPLDQTEVAAAQADEEEAEQQPSQATAATMGEPLLVLRYSSSGLRWSRALVDLLFEHC